MLPSMSWIGLAWGIYHDQAWTDGIEFIAIGMSSAYANAAPDVLQNAGQSVAVHWFSIRLPSTTSPP